MTDGALRVTQSVVEEFTERYLDSLGATIHKKRGTWEVAIPDTEDTDLSSGTQSLHCGSDQDGEVDGELLHPESGFFQRILREAAERCPLGKISLKADQDDVEIPQWIKEGHVEVRESEFVPYYDRTAVVIVFEVSIETVSEYQQELLRAIAIDHRSEQRLPGIEETFLTVTSKTTNDPPTTTTSSLSEEDVRSLLNTAQDHLMGCIEDEIDEIHNEASRAADTEVEEYRQLQQQRIQELEEERAELSSKIEELSEVINDSSQEERVEALKERKETKTEYEAIDSELSDLYEQRDQGFPEKQEQIRKRHALDVQITPRTVTQVEYERGEVDIELAEETVSRTITIGYGTGIGTDEIVRCEVCDRVLNAENVLDTIKDSLRCETCNPSHD